MNQFDTEKTKVLVSRKIRGEKNKLYRKRAKGILKYAAVGLVLMALGFFYSKRTYNAIVPTQQLVVEDEKIILHSENGDTRVINEDDTFEMYNAKGNMVAKKQGKQISYANGADLNELVYNELSIPYGKQFRLTLSDGTQVHLNAGSSLKYPIKFIKGQTREVFLNGEAYFEVEEDKSLPFLVHTDVWNVQVYGTQFNVSSYPEDTDSHVVLVEGSVGLYKEGFELNGAKDIKLVPGQKGEWNRNRADFSIQKVNIHQYTSWRDGELIFRHSTFKNMLTVLERHYNVRIVNKNNALENVLFNASFKKEPIENVLTYFDDILGIEYSIENNTVIIE